MPRSYKFILLFLLPTFVLKAQSQLSTYHFNEVVPQATFLNPAFMPRYKVTVGISTFAAVNTDNVALEDIIRTNEVSGETVFNEDQFLSRLRDRNDFEVYGNGSFIFGTKISKGYMTLAAGARGLSIVDYSKEMADAFLRGFVNEGVVLDELSGELYSTMEFSGSYAYPITKKLTVGARFKYINGIASVDLNDFDGEIFAGVDSALLIDARDVNIRTSGIDAIEDGDYEQLFFSDNRGFGLDFGATYQLTDRITLSASMIDLGRIKWISGTTEYFVEPAQYSFEGFDLLDLIRKDEEEGEGNIIDQEIDTLFALFDFEELDGISYTTRLFSRFFIGGQYQLAEKHRFGATFYGQTFPNRFVGGFGLSYSINIAKLLDLMTGVSLIDGKIDNLNAGLSMQFPGLQIYATTDNILGAILPSRYSVLTAEFGINFNFTRWERKDEPMNTLFYTNPYSEQDFDRKNVKKTKEKRRKINEKKKKRPRAN